MTKLRRHRRDRRGRNTHYGMSRGHGERDLSKFIPTSDSDFAFTAINFAARIVRDPEAHGVTEEGAAKLMQTVKAFRDALAKSMNRRSRTQGLVARKNEARKEAEQMVRLFRDVIRADPAVSASDKKRLRIKVRPTKLKKRKCPKHPPILTYEDSGAGTTGTAAIGGGCGVHVLSFHHSASNNVLNVESPRRAKPDGAVRLELFVDLVPSGEPVPKSPYDRVREGRGFPWYLRSFTKNPIEVEYPLPAQPMLVVYWARWADATGEVSAFSPTCVARIEGWTPGSRSFSGAESAPALDGGSERGPLHAVVQGAEHALPSGMEAKLIEARRTESRLMIVHMPYALPLVGDDDSDRAVEALPPAD